MFYCDRIWLQKMQKRWIIIGSHHHILGSSQPGGNTLSSPPVNLSYLGTEWLKNAGTMDMWWLFWTMPYSLPYGSEKGEKRCVREDDLICSRSTSHEKSLSSSRMRLRTSLSDSKRIWSYSDKATKKMIEVTFSKQWIHFRRSDLWPPTSTIL